MASATATKSAAASSLVFCGQRLTLTVLSASSALKPKASRAVVFLLVSFDEQADPLDTQMPLDA